jgi:hypothetical protein
LSAWLSKHVSIASLNVKIFWDCWPGC